MRLGAAVAALVAFVMGSGESRAETIDWASIALPGLDGESIDPALLTGHPVLVVNTASLCGFTPQYEGLQQLWDAYRDRGLVVLGVPSDDFGGQEYGESGEIKTFCEVNYGIDFPMLERQHVKGSQAHPLFAWITDRAGSVGAPRWNFYKYLIAADGTFVDWYASTTAPTSDAVIAAIEAELVAQ